MAKTPLRAQIDAIELVLANRKGHIENLEKLVNARKRPIEELEVAQRPILGLEAALKTLRWLEANEIRIKKALICQEGA